MVSLHQQSWTAVVVLLFGMLLVCNAAPISARSTTLVFYQYDGRDITAANSPIVTNSTKGFLAIINQALTAGPNYTTDAVVGIQMGTISSIYTITEQYPGENTTNTDGSFYMYGSFDHIISTSEYNGSFILQGAYSTTDNVRNMAVGGGTGDFAKATGYAVVTFVVGNATVSPATAKYEVYLDIPGQK
jgi:hypothetical protein